jgi:hypothetical protein
MKVAYRSIAPDAISSRCSSAFVDHLDPYARSSIAGAQYRRRLRIYTRVQLKLTSILSPSLAQLSFTTKHYSLKRKVRNSNEDVDIRDIDRAANASDVENGLPLVEMVDRDAMSEGNAVLPAVQPIGSQVNSLDRLETTKSR